jgi:hypothetical protein
MTALRIRILASTSAVLVSAGVGALLLLPASAGAHLPLTAAIRTSPPVTATPFHGTQTWSRGPQTTLAPQWKDLGNPKNVPEVDTWQFYTNDEFNLGAHNYYIGDWQINRSSTLKLVGPAKCSVALTACHDWASYIYVYFNGLHAGCIHITSIYWKWYAFGTFPLWLGPVDINSGQSLDYTFVHDIAGGATDNTGWAYLGMDKVSPNRWFCDYKDGGFIVGIQRHSYQDLSAELADTSEFDIQGPTS